MSISAPWRIDYDAIDPFSGASLEFGSYASQILMTAMPVIDSPDLTSQDTTVPRGDGVRFGQDMLGASNITFQLEVDQSNEDDARAAIGAFKRAWRADALRYNPGRVATLTAHTGRVTFGRPRKPPVDATRTFQGRATLTPEFLAADDLWYGDQHLETVTLVPIRVGGVVAPVVAPVVVQGSATDRRTSIQVDGEEPSWTIAKIVGPAVNPVVEVSGRFSFGFATTLAYDEWITIDSRPWARTVLRNDTQNIAMSAGSSSLDRAQLPPGSYELVLRGTTPPAGSPSAQLSWRDAYTHW